MNNNLTILLYHGVADSESIGVENYSCKHISAREFEKQMKFVNAKCTVLSMDEVIEIYERGNTWPANGVAITFDDGFRNNYTVAAPILKYYSLPATFYITAGIVGTDRMFWVDKLEDSINLSKNTQIDLGSNNNESYIIETEKEKIQAINEIKSICKASSKELRELICKQVLEQTEVNPSITHARNYEKISWEELVNLANNSLFTVGGHSMNHDILAFLTSDDLHSDIRASIKLLANNLSMEILHYSYPEGQPEHYNQEVIDVLASNGIKCCPSAIHGTNGFREFDLFNLRRVMVGFNDILFPF